MTFTPEWVQRQNEKRARLVHLPPETKALCQDVSNLIRPNSEPKHDHVKLSIVMRGQIMGGKNGILITRSGHRYPNPKWEKWRNEQVSSVKLQLPDHFQTITTAANVRLTYWAGDMRRRDMPAIIDSIWHVLEKSGVVKDDMLLWVIESSRLYSKENPGALIEFL